ncbi:MAG: redox-regulated ATPase YchF [Candidatus Levybacteria bacterium]|nr:redox-regulated ATPase YchF [Candidatus Levybacteria bacterium]
MNLSVGIVGLPNVGKSTLFNALLKKQAAFVANYPFATIEPNIGIVPVPDARLEVLADITAREIASPGSPKGTSFSEAALAMTKRPPIVPATVKFVDIAGLVKGAAEGEGLGNKFLSHIREVDAICEVVRYFKNIDIAHVSGVPDPESDREVVNTELILADLQTLEKQQPPKKNSTKEDLIKWEGVQKLKKSMDQNKLAREVELSDEEKALVKDLQLLTMKPFIYVANVDENQLKEQFPENTIPISAKIEQELSELTDNEQKEYLDDLGLKESGLERLIKKAYETLGLISFLTAGEKEVRAWTIERGMNAQNAAGVIHTDFIKNFIKAEIVSFNDFVQFKGWKGSREAGKARMEGKEYIMKDGDVVEFKIGK